MNTINKTQSNRILVNECCVLDVFSLNQANIFSGGNKSATITFKTGTGEMIGSEIKVEVNENSIRVVYAIGERELDYEIALDSTAPFFGGKRIWFFCNYCGDRVAKLYLPTGKLYLKCRSCHDLTYRCRKEHSRHIDALVKQPSLILSKLNKGTVRSSIQALRALDKLGS